MGYLKYHRGHQFTTERLREAGSILDTEYAITTSYVGDRSGHRPTTDEITQQALGYMQSGLCLAGLLINKNDLLNGISDLGGASRIVHERQQLTARDVIRGNYDNQGSHFTFVVSLRPGSKVEQTIKDMWQNQQ